jgi:hypothetical protein
MDDLFTWVNKHMYIFRTTFADKFNIQVLRTYVVNGGIFTALEHVNGKTDELRRMSMIHKSQFLALFAFQGLTAGLGFLY